MTAHSVAFWVAHPVISLDQSSTAVHRRLRTLTQRIATAIRRDPALLLLALAVVVAVVFLLTLFTSPVSRRLQSAPRSNHAALVALRRTRRQIRAHTS